MYKISGLLILTFLTTVAFSQQKEFEGIVVYKTDVTSKMEGISNKASKTMLLVGDTTTITIKKGNYRISNAVSETYYITKDQRAYLRFKGIDTLFYREYTDDSTKVKKVSKLSTKKQIAGLECNALSVEMDGLQRQYFYAPALYMNPDYDKNNKLGRYDVYATAASALWLGSVEEHQVYTLTHNCRQVQQVAVADSVFRLPNLPLRKFSVESISTAPEFAGTGGWNGFLSRNINAELGAKYVKIPRGERTGTEQVIVSFIVTEKGRVLNPEVINRKEVHPKLAEEALRVVSISPLWKPATVLGAKTPYRLNQPITFFVEKQ